MASRTFQNWTIEMSFSLSPNTQAILLLTAPLLAGSNKLSSDLITHSEYKKLARFLVDIKCQPSDLLSNASKELISRCSTIIEPTRLERLLGRGFLLSQVVEDWKSRGIWVVSRADTQYPKRLKHTLRENAPALLYGCGDIELLDTGGLAVVGPRKVDESLIEYASSIGALCAQSQCNLISGGAKGIDAAAMKGAQDAWGVVFNVMAEKLEKAAMSRDNRDHILNGKLVLVSAYDPKAGFNVGHAMQRNKMIYGLSQAALVVDASVNKGGTWAGAAEQLERFGKTPIYVRSNGKSSSGLHELENKGALLWPNPSTPAQLIETLDNAIVRKEPLSENGSLAFEHPEEQLPSNEQVGPAEELHSQEEYGDRLYTFIKDMLVEILKTPMTAAEVADTLVVSKSQATSWLSQLEKENILIKQTRPTRYTIAPQIALNI